MTPGELYLKLCEMGAEFEIVEIFEGVRVYRFEVEEHNEDCSIEEKE
jgi:hypothetical protein